MFLRTKVGGAEILIHMLWPKKLFPEEQTVMRYFPAIAELVLFIDFTNDILSYYKEFVLDDEKGNFVSNFAITHHMQHSDVLRNLSAYTPEVGLPMIAYSYMWLILFDTPGFALCLRDVGGPPGPAEVGGAICPGLGHVVYRTSTIPPC